jgi:hypothetical protein
MLTLDELKKIQESLKECRPHVEDFSWGPSLSFAEQRKEEALKLLKREIKELKKNVRDK